MSANTPPPLPPSSVTHRFSEHVREIAWSPDSTEMAAVLASGELVIVNLRDSSQIRRWNAHGFGALRVSWHPKEPWLLTSGEDGFLRVWRTTDGGLVWENKMRGWVEFAAWSPDGTAALAAAGKTLRVFRADGTVSFETSDHPSTISAALWRPDGKGFLSAAFARIQLFRVGEAKPYHDLRWKQSHLAVAWSPNGKHIAAGSQECSVTYWKLPADGKDPLNMSGYQQKVRVLCWDPGSRWLATGGAPSIAVWDVSGKGPAGSTPVMLVGHSERITALAYQKRGDCLASGGLAGDVWLWRPSRGNGGIKSAQMEGEISALDWAPDERSLAIGSAQGELLNLHVG